MRLKAFEQIMIYAPEEAIVRDFFALLPEEQQQKLIALISPTYGPLIGQQNFNALPKGPQAYCALCILIRHTEDDLKA